VRADDNLQNLKAAFFILFRKLFDAFIAVLGKYARADFIARRPLTSAPRG
jgi:hypothetical protein